MQQQMPPQQQQQQQLVVRPVDIKDPSNQMQFDANVVVWNSITNLNRGNSEDKVVIPGSVVQKKLMSTYGPLKTYDEGVGREVPINERTPYVITKIELLGATQQPGAPHDLAFRILDVPSKGVIVPVGHDNVGEFHSTFTRNQTDTLFEMSANQMDVIREWASVASGAKLAREGNATGDAFLKGCNWIEKDPEKLKAGDYDIYIPLNRDGYHVETNPQPLMRVLSLPAMAEIMDPLMRDHIEFTRTTAPCKDNLRTQGYIRVPANVVALAKVELKKTCIDNLYVRHLQDNIVIQVVRPDGHPMDAAANTENAQTLHGRRYKYTAQLRFTVALPGNKRVFV